ncbi:MAG: DUF3857 and transglutaminase domain-containing protein, partial [Steroidobacteraceae bacterium]
MLLLTCGAAPASAGSAAPEWLRAAAAVPLPAHDEKTPAVVLYSEIVLSVQADGRVRRLQRIAVRILRPEGASRGVVSVVYDAQSRVRTLRGWSLPAQGKEFETRDKDIADTALNGVDGGVLVSDLRARWLRIPAAVAGSVVGYEVEQEERPYFISDLWDFQDAVPTVEARYSLELPPGWAYQATWLNHSSSDPQSMGPGLWQWTLRDVGPVRIEQSMPPWRRVGGHMMLSLVPPVGRGQALLSWRDVGDWYLGLARGRSDPNADIHQKVLALTSGEATALGKARSLAKFVQSEIRYVGIELGIGSFQPHAASEVYAHRYGDCKDKATLLSAMLSDIGIESYFVIINTVRGAMAADTPPNLGFNHVIVAIRLPDGAADPSLQAVMQHPRLGRILFFDPTDDLTPLGGLRGELQASYALLAAPGAGELLATPQLPVASSGLRRTGRFTLDGTGTLRGDVTEERLGDDAMGMRESLRSVTVDTDRIRRIEFLVANSLANFRIVQAAVGGVAELAKPLVWRYALEAEGYAKVNGDLLLVRPRVLGVRALSLLEVPEPRENAIEFEGPARDTDSFEIELPAGYAVEELP